MLSSLPVLLAACPLAWLALFYLFVVRARLHLGYWPAPYRPDPKDLGFTLHYWAISWGSWAPPVAALATLALIFVGRRLAVSQRIWPALTLLVISVALVVVLVWLDPGAFFGWFAD